MLGSTKDRSRSSYLGVFVNLRTDATLFLKQEHSHQPVFQQASTFVSPFFVFSLVRVINLTKPVDSRLQIMLLSRATLVVLPGGILSVFTGGTLSDLNRTTL